MYRVASSRVVGLRSTEATSAWTRNSLQVKVLLGRSSPGGLGRYCVGKTFQKETPSSYLLVSARGGFFSHATHLGSTYVPDKKPSEGHCLPSFRAASSQKDQQLFGTGEGAGAGGSCWPRRGCPTWAWETLEKSHVTLCGRWDRNHPRDRKRGNEGSDRCFWHGPTQARGKLYFLPVSRDVSCRLGALFLSCVLTHGARVFFSGR